MVPVRAKRLGPARFELEFHEPIAVDPDADPKRAALAAMTRFNAVLEDWIRERPDEWMCAKRRWPKTSDCA
jgi:KDO2-lipid IV(A) lauroyltransferase